MPSKKVYFFFQGLGICDLFEMKQIWQVIIFGWGKVLKAPCHHVDI